LACAHLDLEILGTARRFDRGLGQRQLVLAGELGEHDGLQVRKPYPTSDAESRQPAAFTTSGTCATQLTTCPRAPARHLAFARKGQYHARYGQEVPRADQRGGSALCQRQPLGDRKSVV